MNGLPLRASAPAARRRWLLLVELLIVAALFYGDYKHLVPFSEIPFLLPLAWASLRLRKLAWKDVGLKRSDSWLKTILIGVSAGIGIELLELFVTQPFRGRSHGPRHYRDDGKRH